MTANEWQRLFASLAAEQQRSAGHRADYERERERADRMVTTQDRMVAELENLRTLLEVAQQSAQVVTLRTWSEMTWRRRIRWLRTTGWCAMSWWDFLTLLFAPSRRSATRAAQRLATACPETGRETHDLVALAAASV
jgi:hypothetical protein